MTDDAPPKVFISYSWTSDAHVAWVEGLATRLLTDGVDVVFDRYDLKKGHDKFAFMERMVTDKSVKYVLAICDAKYAAKADDRIGGVGTETQIISPEVYNSVEQEKFIPLVRERSDSGEACLPTFFKSRIYIDFSNDDNFEEAHDELLRVIFDAPAKKKPPIGKPPAHLFATTPTHVKTAGAYQRLKNAVENQRPHVKAYFEAYLNLFLDSLEDFRLTPTKDNRATWDEEVVASIDHFTPYRDNFVECLLLMLSFTTASETDEALIAFLEKLIPFQELPDNTGGSEVDCDNFAFITCELFLYLIAACLRAKRYGSAALFIESEYHLTKRCGGTEFYVGSSCQCESYIKSLEVLRKQRLKLTLLSVTGQMLHDRAPSGPISSREIAQVDFLLYVRTFFPNRGAFNHWYPRCLPYLGRLSTLELFAKATTARGLEPLKILLRVPDVNGLMDGFERLLTDAAEHPPVSMHSCVSLEQLMNLDELNRVTGRAIGSRR